MTGKAIRFLAGIGLLLACSLSARAQLPAFFNGAVPLGSHWNYLQFANGYLFGYYNDQYSPDVYHNDLGWEHVIDAGDGQNGVYLYDYAGSSWFYTTPALFPTLSDITLGHSLTYQVDPNLTGHYTSNPRKFQDLTTNQLITLGPAGTAIGLLPSTPNLLSITGGGNGGGNTGHAPPGVTGSFAFTFNDAFYGANYIVGGQVSLMDGTGQNHCQLSWGRPNTLDSSDGGFCTVSLVSIVNSTSDPTAVTVTLNYTFSGAAPPGDYSVIAMVCDKDVLCSPPGTVGTWTVDGTAPPLTIMTSSLPGATAGMPYSLTLSGTGGAGNYSWSAAGLPSGLTLSAAGVLSGTASPDGVSPITVTLADGAGGRVTANYGLTVAPQSLSSVTSSQGYTYNDGVSRSSSYCLGPQGGGCYATGNSQYLQSCSVRKPDGSQLPFSSVAVTPASNTPYFSVSYNASQTMPPDSGNLTCVYQGAVIHGPAVSIYDATPHITGMSPGTVAQGTTAVPVTFTGWGFGTAQPTLLIGPSLPYLIASGNTPSGFTALITPSAVGTYSVSVQSTGNNGISFVSGGTPPSTNTSSGRALNVIHGYPLIQSIQVDGQTVDSLLVGTGGYIAIYGKNLDGLTQVSLNGTGASITGIQYADPANPGQVNVYYSVDATAPIGPRTLTLITSYGASTFGTTVVPTVTITGDPGVALGGSTDYTVTLSADATNEPIELDIATLSGTGTAQFDDGTTSRIITGSTTVTIQGVLESSTADNIGLLAKPQQRPSRGLARQNASVVTVSITMRASGNLSSSNTAASYFMLKLSNTLGAVVTKNVIVPSYCAMAVEFVGQVKPTNYAGPVTLRRDVIGGSTYQNSSSPYVLIPAGDDTSFPEYLDNAPGVSGGNVYDLDSPGIGAPSAPAAYRYRANLQEYAVLGDPGSTKRVSPLFPWWARVSCQKNQSGLVFFNSDVANDNQAGSGTTPKTWNLQ